MAAIKPGKFAENKPILNTILHHAFGNVKPKIIPTRIPTAMKMNTLDNIATTYFIKTTHLSSHRFYQGYSPFSVIMNTAAFLVYYSYDRDIVIAKYDLFIFL
jgi:hypothetical protein